MINECLLYLTCAGKALTRSSVIDPKIKLPSSICLLASIDKVVKGYALIYQQLTTTDKLIIKNEYLRPYQSKWWQTSYSKSSFYRRKKQVINYVFEQLIDLKLIKVI